MACTLITTRQHNDLRYRATHREGQPTVSTNLPMKTLARNVTRHLWHLPQLPNYCKGNKNKPSTRKQTPTRRTSHDVSSRGGTNCEANALEKRTVSTAAQLVAFIQSSASIPGSWPTMLKKQTRSGQHRNLCSKILCR